MLVHRTRSLALCLAASALIALSASASARADAVTDWNVNAVDSLVGTAGQSPTVSTVHLAMVHGAVYDAVNSIDGRYEPYLVDVRARDWYSKDAATDPWPAAQWRPVLPAFGNDPGAWVKDVKPFLIRDPARYGGAAPYSLTSKSYARELAEVKAAGALNSTTRTADQTDQARFWAEGPQPWTRVARRLAIDRGLSSRDSARMFAMLYMTGADALISVWNDKANWLFWRPITAIREAAA